MCLITKYRYAGRGSPVSQVLRLHVLLTWAQSRQRHLATLGPMETRQSRLTHQGEAQKETAKLSSVCG